VTFDQLGKALERAPAGTKVDVSVFRRSRLRTIPVVLGEAPAKELRLGPAKSATPDAKKLYESWLGEAWSPPKPSEPTG